MPETLWKGRYGRARRTALWFLASFAVSAFGRILLGEGSKNHHLSDLV
jgi:hypothetical protein